MICSQIQGDIIHHPHIGHDEHLHACYAKYGFKVAELGQRGPHQDRELNLMLAGLKPCAVINDLAWGIEWEKACDDHDWSVSYESRSNDYCVATRKESWRITALSNVYSKIDVKGHMSVLDHTLVGLLLGYRWEDIQYWNNYINRSNRVPIQIALV